MIQARRSARFRVLLAAAFVVLLAASPSQSQPRPSGPALSASRSVMAGSMLGVTVSGAPAGARLAVARPDDPATRAIVVMPLSAGLAASLQTPGEAGAYELRLTQDRDGASVILRRQPLATTPPAATISAPARVARGKTMPARGSGPNGERDRIVIVASNAPADAVGPFFYPAENIEAVLEAPEQPGEYELRYIMHAPLAEHRILARQPVTVE